MMVNSTKIKHNYLSLLLLVLVGMSVAYAQQKQSSTDNLRNWIDHEIMTAMDSLHIPGVTFALVHNDSIVYTKGYGLADIETNVQVSDSTTLFGIASISKTFVGVSIMQLYEDGKLTLDEDVNTYLKSLQLDYNYEPPITIRHLLTHTAGIDEGNLGNRVRTEQEFTPLGEYLGKKLPPQIRPPAEAISYNNFGYALLGLIIEDVTGLAFDEYVRINILEPLDMNLTSFKQHIHDEALYAKSYKLKGEDLIVYPKSYILQYPAGAITSNAKEMSSYMSMLLNYGTYKNNKVLDSTTVVKLFSPAFKHYKKAQNAWLWGFYEDHWNGLRIVQHAGDIDGFASLLLLIPEKGIGFFISVNSSSLKDRTNRGFIQRFTDKLLTKVFSERADMENNIDLPEYGSVSKPLKSFEGVYRPTRYAQSTMDKVALFIGLRPDITISVKNDKLVIDDNKDELIPISDLGFYAVKQKKYVAFKADKNGNISYYLSDNQAFHKLRWFESVKFQAIAIGSIALVFVIFIFGSIIRRLFTTKKKTHLIGKLNLSISLLSLLFLITFGYTLMTTDPGEFLYGLPFIVKASLILPLLIILLTAYSLYVLVSAIRQNKTDFWKFNYILTITALVFMAWLSFWNLIGFNY